MAVLHPSGGPLWARFLSVLFQPYAVLSYWLLLVAVLRPGEARVAAAAWVASVALPVAALLAGKRRGWWGGSELVSRTERFSYLPVSWAGSALGWLIARRWAPGSLLAASLEAVAAWLAAVALLTLAWKVSLHTGAIGLMTGVAAWMPAGVGAVPRLAAVALGTALAVAVAASRLALRRHTPAQLVVGFLMGLAAALVPVAAGSVP
ncbi:MAG: hypothetical protein QJR14_08065 [Bacillota bacterium]|nr:hypothetical protein [Bacillota bacterium]